MDVVIAEARSPAHDCQCPYLKPMADETAWPADLLAAVRLPHVHGCGHRDDPLSPLTATVYAITKPLSLMKCRVCSCTDDRACVYEDESGRVFTCSWVEVELCSACAYWPPAKRIGEHDVTEVAR